MQRNSYSDSQKELSNEIASANELVLAMDFQKLKAMLNGACEFVDVNQYGLGHAKSTYTK